VNIADAIASVSLLISVGGILYHSGRTAERFRQTQEQARRDANGIGMKCREIETRAASQWKQLLAALIDSTEDQKKREMFTRLLREG
jgi:3-methyladenine DNA glycosylase/8-oxoguanine DNA glycosylase